MYNAGTLLTTSLQIDVNKETKHNDILKNNLQFESRFIVFGTNGVLWQNQFTEVDILQDTQLIEVRDMKICQKKKK